MSEADRKPESRPRVLVTRSARQGSTLADELRALGLEPVIVPAIEIVEPASFNALDEAIEGLRGFDWLVFTSANAVEAFVLRRGRHGSALARDTPRIVVIGVATATAAQAAGLSVSLQPEVAVAEALTAALLPFVRQADGRATRFLLVRAEQAREHLPYALRSAGAQVTIAPAYRTCIPRASQTLVQTAFADEPALRAIAFTSSSTARNLVALCEAAGTALPEGALRISIGPVTSRTLHELGLPPHAEASEASVASLAHAVLEALQIKA